MKKPVKTIGNAMKADKKLDKQMTPAMMKKDIQSDRKLLAAKIKAKK